MQKPFPELTRVPLYLSKAVTAVPDSILGGSAPRLRLLRLDGITFPGMPKLLLFTTRFIFLHIPHPEHFTLDAIIPVLSSLTCLGSLYLEFQSPRSRPNRTPSPRPPLCQLAEIQRRRRLLGATRGLHRYFSTRGLLYNLLQSNRI